MAAFLRAAQPARGGSETRCLCRGVRQLGKIDGGQNNAGNSLFGAAKSLTDEQSSVISVQTCSAQSRRCAALPHLPSKGRRIIQFSTYGVQGIFPGGSLDHASKWGVEGFFDSMMQELAPFHIGVTIVVPAGGARTSILG